MALAILELVGRRATRPSGSRSTPGTNRYYQLKIGRSVRAQRAGSTGSTTSTYATPMGRTSRRQLCSLQRGGHGAGAALRATATRIVAAVHVQERRTAARPAFSDVVEVPGEPGCAAEPLDASARATLDAAMTPMPAPFAIRRTPSAAGARTGRRGCSASVVGRGRCSSEHAVRIACAGAECVLQHCRGGRRAGSDAVAAGGDGDARPARPRSTLLAGRILRRQPAAPRPPAANADAVAATSVGGSRQPLRRTGHATRRSPFIFGIDDALHRRAGRADPASAAAADERGEPAAVQMKQAEQQARHRHPVATSIGGCS